MDNALKKLPIFRDSLRSQSSERVVTAIGANLEKAFSDLLSKEAEVAKDSGPDVKEVSNSIDAFIAVVAKAVKVVGGDAQSIWGGYVEALQNLKATLLEADTQKSVAMSVNAVASEERGLHA